MAWSRRVAPLDINVRSKQQTNMSLPSSVPSGQIRRAASPFTPIIVTDRTASTGKKGGTSRRMFMLLCNRRDSVYVPGAIAITSPFRAFLMASVIVAISKGTCKTLGTPSFFLRTPSSSTQEPLLRIKSTSSAQAVSITEEMMGGTRLRFGELETRPRKNLAVTRKWKGSIIPNSPLGCLRQAHSFHMQIRRVPMRYSHSLDIRKNTSKILMARWSDRC